MWRRTAAFLAIGLALAGEAEASQARDPFRLGPWMGSAFFNDNGSFHHCAAGVGVPNRVGFSVHVLHDHLWAFVVVNSAWKPAVGTALPVEVTFDGARTLHVYGRGTPEGNVAIIMPETDAAIATFRSAQRMTLFANGASYDFELTASAQLFDRLQQCAQAHMNQTVGARPPLGDGTACFPAAAQHHPGCRRRTDAAVG